MMTSLYSYRWTSTHGLSDRKLDTDGKPTADSGIWGKVLAGLNGKSLAKGVSGCVERGKQNLARGQEDWPPTAPEFRAMCEWSPSDLGVPGMRAAFSECVGASSDPAAHAWSHELVRLAGKATGWWEIRNNVPNEAALRKRFEVGYGQLIQKLQRGDPLEEPAKLLEHEGETLTVEQVWRRSVALADKIADDQGLTGKTPHTLRQELLEKMGIKR